ncbi:hypothetical protein AD998_10995 [bacterium 336/3]|nr:hypothetical protein AD998_10995 [bacterium 336/3]
MQAQPKYASLTQQEIKFLKKGREEGLWLIIILVLASILTKYLFSHIPNAEKINNSWLILALLLVGIALLAGIYYGIKRYLNYQLDIRTGQKICISGIIEDKFSSTGKNATYYFVVIVGQKFKIPNDIEQMNYDLRVDFVQKGDNATIWFSPKTKTVFWVANQVFLDLERITENL